jgi:hypothetical protein
MDILFWGLTFGIIGKVMLGVAVILVHGKVVHEHRIDKAVLLEMKRERNITLIAILFMIIGYALELSYFGLV